MLFLFALKKIVYDKMSIVQLISSPVGYILFYASYFFVFFLRWILFKQINKVHSSFPKATLLDILSLHSRAEKWLWISAISITTFLKLFGDMPPTPNTELEAITAGSIVKFTLLKLGNALGWGDLSLNLSFS